MFATFFAPDLEKRKARLLLEAEHELLDAHKNVENAQAILDATQKRVMRLRNMIPNNSNQPMFTVQP